MTEKRITVPAGEDYERACALYRESFPLHEQRLPRSQAAALADEEYHFVTLWEGEEFAGLLFYWETEEYYYVEHFAISPHLRGRNYGTAALQLLCAKGKTVLLEIDPPVDDVSKRRLHFYERLGFQPNPYRHLVPPYRAGLSDFELVVLSYPEKLSPAVFQSFSRYLHEIVMSHGESQERE